MILFAVQMYLPVLLHLTELTIKLDLVVDPSVVCKILPFNDQVTVGAGFPSIRQVNITVVFSSTVYVVLITTFSTFASSKVYNYMLLKKSFKLANMTKANYFTFLNMINLPHKKTLKLDKKLERSNSEIRILLIPFC